MIKTTKVKLFSGPVYGIDAKFKYIPPVSDEVNEFLKDLEGEADNIHIQTCCLAQQTDEDVGWVVVTVTYELKEFEEWEKQY